MKTNETQSHIPNFTDTAVAFEAKSDDELRQTAWMFYLMNFRFLVNLLGNAAIWAVRLRVPFVRTIIRKTLYKQFCGGENLKDAEDTIAHLYKFGVNTMLDYGAEGKNDEVAFDLVIEENLKSIEFAASNESVKVISTKISGLTENDILEKVQQGKSLDDRERAKFKALKDRLHRLCNYAEERNVGVFVDAEESWIQDTIDGLVLDLMARYNQGTIIVYNTYQMYRTDMLANLKRDFARAQREGFILGAKLVRGAYMEKERARAKKYGYPSPIHETKSDTDKMYNDGIRFCMENYEHIAFANASHNMKSMEIQVDLIQELRIPKDHVHVNFCQLMGMSDHLTYNLANEG
ncbi:MAG: proline dehydrogenase, partial [Bacteroidetes bacterium]|nr:proline dehydrogenase [Bacteroidota bacterium]